MDGVVVVVVMVNLSHGGRGVVAAATADLIRIGDQPFAQIGLDAVADVAD